ncbi:glycosyltransferase family 1 protein [Conexibacter sp. DBS9H8]|uniref:glycosyltransferase family 4 protein n=1 Tax=Conexibacter sp. DBS9H8 TaxID=2937801 RepID=UPI00200E4DBB|nr:glycosyltransferase family 1 protein [Conexibacter sp. DBS9H8]
MRVAIVSEVFLPAVDGVVTRLMRTLEEFSAGGDDVVLIAPRAGAVLNDYAGIPVIGVPELRLPLYPDGEGYPPKRVALPGPALGRVLRSVRPDLIHAINPVLLAAGAVAHAHQRRLPLVASYHANLATYANLYRIGWLSGAGWRYIRMLHNNADVNLATSAATAELLRQQGVERVDLWPYGIETERFCPEKRSPQWRDRLSGGAAEELPVLLYVGRLAKEKTVERLLEAAQRPDARLAIVGDGPLRQELEQTFSGTGTTFHGFLGGEDLAQAYASADVFLMPSETETLGFVTLEAQASGLPVIAAESPAARELIAHGDDGLRYAPASPGALNAAVDTLVRDPELRARMGRTGREKAVGATWARATDVLRGHYRRAYEAHAADPRGLAA